MKKRDYNEGKFELKLIDVTTHLRKCDYHSWDSDEPKRHDAFKFRCQRVKIIPKSGYQFELNFDA